MGHDPSQGSADGVIGSVDTDIMMDDDEKMDSKGTK